MEGFTDEQIAAKKKGRTKEQQTAVSYVCMETGCFGKAQVEDAEYDQMVLQKIKATDWKQKALNKLGLDESQVQEVEPIHFQSFRFDEKTIDRLGEDKKWRSSEYQISWIFASDTEIYVWQYTFSMIDDTKKERTEEYFYKDITNFSTSAETLEKYVPVLEKHCLKKEKKWLRQNVDYNKFSIVVPGDKFYCSIEDDEYVEAAVQGLKAKLREKKA